MGDAMSLHPVLQGSLRAIEGSPHQSGWGSDNKEGRFSLSRWRGLVGGAWVGSSITVPANVPHASQRGSSIGVREVITQYKGGFSIGEMGVLFGSFGRCLIMHTRG